MPIPRRINNDAAYRNLNEEEATDTLGYIGTVAELMEAGIGFSVRHIDEMPEHESQFVPTPGLRASDIDREMRAIEKLLAEEAEQRRPL